MTTSAQWISEIERACAEVDPALCNRRITELHYSLSEALAQALGRDGGPNFHTWAVWGSKKAGVTIRQEDLDDAIQNAFLTAGFVGCIFGAAIGAFLARRLGWSSHVLGPTLGGALGAATGAFTGKHIAVRSRAQASSLVMQGNQTVLRDIGAQSAIFIELLENGATPERRAEFFAGIRLGPTEALGQDRLAVAFHHYLAAFDAKDPDLKREAMIKGNSEIVYHEHIRLEPYIRGAMPWIIRRCATQRMMTYQVDQKVFTVSEDVSGVAAHTAESDWTNIDERMRYVFALFQRNHDDPSVFGRPYPTSMS